MRRAARVLRAATAGGALALLSAVAAAEQVVHVERSALQTLVVTESDTRRCLRFGEQSDALSQSCRLRDRPDHLALEYTRAMVAVLLLWQPAPQRVLLIGVGGGSIPMALRSVRPGIDIDAVDIDPGVLRIAQRYFGLRPGPALRLHAADGRDFVKRARVAGAVYDAVLLDAFDADGIPPALYGEAFLRDLRALLAPRGVFLANTFATSASAARETAVAAQVFGRFHELRVGAGRGNRLIVAAADAARLPTAAALKAALPDERAALARIGIDALWVVQLDFGKGR